MKLPPRGLGSGRRPLPLRPGSRWPLLTWPLPVGRTARSTWLEETLGERFAWFMLRFVQVTCHPRGTVGDVTHIASRRLAIALEDA